MSSIPKNEREKKEESMKGKKKKKPYDMRLIDKANKYLIYSLAATRSKSKVSLI